MRDDFYGEVAKQAAQPGGGATVNVNTGEQPESGWVVARAGHEHVEPKQTFSEQSLRRYASGNRSALEQSHHMGLWHPSRVGAGRPKGIYHDVVDVHPDTYEGGVKSIVEGYRQGQDAIFNLDRGQELSMHPQTQGQRRATIQATRALRQKRPAALGPETRISQMSPQDLGAALRGRRTIQEGPPG